MYYTGKKEILNALYRHMILTAQQLSVLLHYRVPSIYGMVMELKGQGLVRRIPLPFLRKNHVGYTLTAYGARAAATLAGEEEIFRAKAWEEDPVQLEHIFGTNAFFISLIQHSLDIAGEGLVEWLDTRETAERYVLIKDSGQKFTPLRPDGFGTYILPHRGKLVFHLEYDTGTETLWRLQDKLWNYGRILSGIWNDVESVHVLILTKVEGRSKSILKLWKSLCKGQLFGINVPQVWSIHEKVWEQNGPDSALWWGIGKDGKSLKEMNVLPFPADSNLPFLGKQIRERSPSVKNE